MTAPPELDADAGRLLIAPPTLDVLVAHAADPVGAALAPGATEELARLQVAGVIRGPRAHPVLADALAAMVAPRLCTLELSYAGRSMQGWASYDASALLLPEREDADGRRVLLARHPTLLPDVLARLADLGPRPHPEGAPVRYEDGAISGVLRHWRLAARWTLDSGARGGSDLEVVDTEGGLWLLEPSDDGLPLAWPVTPTFVWRRIVRLVMRRDADATR